ncbi:MAG TPA: MoxR family ATPase [Nitratifractor sp.]|nr:MoxR family ATPase [Nitratifractor sp.]HHD75119.1 MoxR family ATPase [Nitratifractor sp.]HHH20466.1 MoxR family ATPase [Nitratifractor sp.]
MIEKIKQEIAKAVIGHEELVDAMIIALLCEGHILVEGVPGVAKTTAVNALAKTLGFDFKRVQFTPDLLPSDIIGNEILDLKSNEYKIKHGPIFTNLLLADEINRSSPKVQSALLEAMAESQVTIGEESFKLQKPFMVLATANPIDQEGTYELPEASLDRFLLKVNVGYNTPDEELKIMELSGDKKFLEPQQVLDYKGLEELQEELEAVHIDDALKKYIVQIIEATREPQNSGLEELAEYIEFGVSPRGTIATYRASKAQALLAGRDFVTPADIAKSLYLTLPHRIKLSYQALIDGIDSRKILEKILIEIPAP